MPEGDHTREGTGATQRRSSLRANLVSAVGAVLVVALGIVGVMWFAGSSGDKSARDATQSRSSQPEVMPVSMDKLTESTTHTRLEDVPKDSDPQARTEGDIVRPDKMLPLHDRPDGRRIGKVGPKQIGETWLPVVAEQDGWVKVLLPSKPNGSTGWLDAGQVTKKVTPYLITVHLESKRLQLFNEGREVGNWEIGIGKPDTPTPTGRTFLLGSIVDPDQPYSPIILPLGSHSDTLDSFGGGPGTVAIHTWPDPDEVLGKANSHGCIRVSKEALDKLTEVPLGTLVLVDNQ